MSNEELGFGLVAFSMLIMGFKYCNQWVYSGKSLHGILGVALIFGAILVAVLAPVSGAA